MNGLLLIGNIYNQTNKLGRPILSYPILEDGPYSNIQKENYGPSSDPSMKLPVLFDLRRGQLRYIVSGEAPVISQLSLQMKCAFVRSKSTEKSYPFVMSSISEDRNHSTTPS